MEENENNGEKTGKRVVWLTPSDLEEFDEMMRRPWLFTEEAIPKVRRGFYPSFPATANVKKKKARRLRALLKSKRRQENSSRRKNR